MCENNHRKLVQKDRCIKAEIFEKHVMINERKTVLLEITLSDGGRSALITRLCELVESIQSVTAVVCFSMKEK